MAQLFDCTMHNKFSFKKAICYTGLQAFRISQ